MKTPIYFGLALAGLLLAGCTDADWQHATSFAGMDAAPPAAEEAPPAAEEASVAAPTPMVAPTSAPMPVAQAAPVDPFCQAVAVEDTQGNGFDAATQRSVLERSYRQCATLFANVTPH